MTTAALAPPTKPPSPPVAAAPPVPRRESLTLIWVRARNAAGRGRDPQPQLIHGEFIGPQNLEIVARHPIGGEALLALVGADLDALAEIYPAPLVGD